MGRERNGKGYTLASELAKVSSSIGSGSAAAIFGMYMMTNEWFEMLLIIWSDSSKSELER